MQQDSAEWAGTVQCMGVTMPHAVILRVQRVQNPLRWRKYLQKLQDVREKCGGAEQKHVERWLFHGTRGCDPRKVQQEGFDMRMSSENNLWGKGCYFAVNASYSHQYRFRLSSSGDGQAQIFLARVLTGESKALAAEDRTLVRPPYQDKLGPHGEPIAYDSVNGVTQGSQVYIVYENDLAYPEYLVTYQV